MPDTELLPVDTPAAPVSSATVRTVALVGAGVLGAGLLQAQATAPNDIDLLNYALTLEHLEAAFYNQGLRQFSNVDLARSTFAQSLGETASGELYAYLSLIRSHENAHVRTLESLLRSFAATPVAPCRYNFDFSTVDAFLSTARTLENTGVSAYAGALSLIRSPRLRTAAATIAMVEARHASYLNVIGGNLAAPDAFDTAKTMAEILQIAAPFLAACPA
ncbi:MAG: ferritin-like domain-containing protein [Bryobacteraceae bacterium]